jgi:serine/threonine protein kinase/tetratricopeptide (TPR) repeat protein
MSNAPVDSPRAVRDAFLEAYRQDLATGLPRPLEDYQRQFPGHEAEVAEEWAWLEPGSVTGVDHEPGAAVTQQSLGPYRIVRELGQGAQATVYLAEHETLHRRVALKVLRASLGAPSSTAARRFRREAEVTASLEHPGICSIYDTGQSGGLTWIAMQYVPGTTLAARLARRDLDGSASELRLPQSDASAAASGSSQGGGSSGRSDLMQIVAFVEHAARALHLAHERGLVHRDIKPGNLMVADDGRPVVLDFGLAHAGEGDALGLTRSTDVLGTPNYMAPEQLRSDTNGGVDRRTDIYALGVTLYECLTRRRPFAAVSREALYQQILTAEPTAPRSLNPQIPRDLEVVLQTAIEKDRNRRYQTALAFAEDLRRVRQYEPIQARPISAWGRLTRWARRHPDVAGSAAVAFAALVAGLTTSLVFLQDANRALAEKHGAMQSWYDDLSRSVAHSDTIGEGSPIVARLHSMATSLIEAEVAGCRERYPSVFQLSCDGRSATGDEDVPRHVRAVGELRGRLSPTARVALADLVHPQARQILQFVRREVAWEPIFDAQALQLGRWIEADLQVLPATDLRLVRARIFLLDALQQSGLFAEAERQAESWRREEVGGPIPDPVRVALLESRLGGALLGQGKLAAARDALERSVAIVQEHYPSTVYGNVATAHLLRLYEKAGTDKDLSRLRLDFAIRILQSRDDQHHEQRSAYVLSAAAGPYRSLWDLNMEIFRRSFTPMSDAELDEFMERFERGRAELGVADSDPIITMQSGVLQVSAVHQSLVRGLEHPLVGRMMRRSRELRDISPPAHWLRMCFGSGDMGHHLNARGEFAVAVDRFREAMAFCPAGSARRSQYGGSLGLSLAQIGAYDEAEQRLLHALNVATETGDGSQGGALAQLDRLVTLSRLQGDLARTVAWHHRLIELRGAALDHHRLGATYLRFGRLTEAEEALAKALALDPEDAVVGRHRAYIALLRGEWDRAIERAAAVVEADPGAGRVHAQALLARGDAEVALEHFAAAAASVENWVNGDGFWSDYGAALVACGRPADAREILRKLTERRPGDPWTWHARARFLATTDGLTPADRAAAVTAAQKANELCNRGRAAVLAMLAEAQFRAGDAAAARATAAAVQALMDGRDALWLSVDDMKARALGYR